MDYKQKWNALDPARKKQYMILFGIIAIFGFAYISTTLTSKKEYKKPQDDSLEVEVMVPKRRDATLEELSAQQMAATRKLNRLENQLQSTQKLLENRIQELLSQLNTGQKLTQDRELKSDMEYLRNRLKRMEAQMAQQTAQKQSISPRPTSPVNKIEIPSLTGSGGKPSGDNADNKVEIPGFERKTIPSPSSSTESGVAEPGISYQESAPAEPKHYPLRIVSGGNQFTAQKQPGAPGADFSGEGGYPSQTTNQLEPSAAATVGGITDRETRDLQKTSEKPKDVYLPSGSMFSGILINGLDAVTSNANRRNPTPVLIRVKRDAILPNYYSLQIRECFVTAGGYGDMSTERAIMRTERISCVRDDGGVIDAPLDGYIIGEDGKVGMRGRLVMRQGAMMTRAAIAGLLSGFAQALEPQGVTGITIGVPGENGNTTPATRYSMSDVMEAGLYGGISKASDKVAEYYLDMVDQIKPVIEVDAGRKATIIIVKGTNLKLG